MALKKKGIFFTTAAIGLTLIALLMYAGQNNRSDRADVALIRVDTMNFLLKSIEGDLSNGAKIASIRTLMSFNDYIDQTGAFIDDVALRFNESFTSGTISGEVQQRMTDYSFNDWKAKMSREAEKIGVIFNASVERLQINQSEPWYVDLNISVVLNLSDQKGTSKWLSRKDILVKVSIKGINDPLYTFNNDGLVNNSIITSNITSFVVNKNTSAILNHTNASYYINRSSAPSILMRFEGKLGSSKAGIESLVNLKELSDNGISLLDRSIIDHVYFGTAATANNRINNTPFWFKVDDANLAQYSLQDITCVPAQCQIVNP